MTRLLKIVFSIYFVITVALTCLHMGAEFYYQKVGVVESLKVTADTFKEGLGNALWNMNTEQMKATFLGMTNLPIIEGVLIEDHKGEVIGAIGLIQNEQGKSLIIDQTGHKTPSSRFKQLFWYEFLIQYDDRGTIHTVGKGKIFSSTSVVFEKVQVGYIIILFNSMVKSMALLYLLIMVFRKILSEPLAEFAHQTSQLDLDNLDTSKIKTNTIGNNEIKLLENSFNAMIQKLTSSRVRMEEVLREVTRQEMELKTAQVVQELLIPSSDPEFEQIELASYYSSASETGGDWYNYFYNQQDSLSILIGDVSGHGVPAAIITGFASSVMNATLAINKQSDESFHDYQHHFQHPSYVLEIINNVLFSSIKGTLHMTMIHSIFDLKRKRLIYSNAGHNFILVFRPGNFEDGRGKQPKGVRILRLAGEMLGMSADVEYPFDMIELQTGDVVVWYTDGLIENTDPQGNPFLLRRLKLAVQEVLHQSAKEIRDHVVKLANDFYAGQPYEDDVTLIIGKVK